MNKNNPFSTVIVGDLANNCYLVPGPVSGKLYIIDPADEASIILESAKAYTFTEAVILLTHAHVDHIQACGAVAKALNIKKVYLNQRDHEMYWSPLNHLLPSIPAAQNLPQDMPYEENEDFKVFETPGHTPGGVCLFFPAYKTIFTGDTLFRGTIGNTDHPGGSEEDLIKSIQEKLMTLDDDVKVCPGHMLASTIGDERACNPYLS